MIKVIFLKLRKNLPVMVSILFCFLGSSQVKEAIDFQDIKGSEISKAQSQFIFTSVKQLPNKSQLSFAIIKNGAINFYGIERSQDSIFSTVNFEKAFEIGSITKVFTCTLLADLVLENKIDLDDTIHPHLRYSLKDSVHITFKQLANHTAGLPRLPSNLDLEMVDNKNPYKDYGEDDLKVYLTKELELLQSPGEKNVYSNLSVGLLGHILTLSRKQSYEALLQSMIFSKYKMNNSTTIRENIEERLVQGLNEKGEPTPNWDMSVLKGAGGIISTIADLSKFAVAQFEPANEELALTQKVNFKASDAMELGLGWALIKISTGDIWLWHNGGTGGYTSSIILDTSKKNGVIVLSNVSAYSEQSANITNLTADLMESLD